MPRIFTKCDAASNTALKIRGRSLPVSNRPMWDGKSNGKPFTVLMVPEQGLGDTIQFARYATLVQQHGGRVVFQVPKQLSRLMTTYVPWRRTPRRKNGRSRRSQPW